MLGETVEVIIDAGPSPQGADSAPSTIIDVTGRKVGCCASARSASSAQRGAGATGASSRRGLTRLREYVLVFLVAVAATYSSRSSPASWRCARMRWREVRDRDVHDEPIPYLGGIAMMGGLVAAYLVARELPFLSRADPLRVRAGSRVVLLAGAADLRRRVCSTTSSTSTR